VYALIHSPLVGPLTWRPVADALRRRGIEACVPTLEDTENSGLAYWRQEVESAARALRSVPADRRLILVGHSGAGSLLPAIRQALDRPVAAYLFVDAGIHVDGLSRHDLMAAESAEIAEQFKARLATGERFPNWSEEDLREIIPDDDLRRGMLAELRPRPLAYFLESIPIFSKWPDAPCGYLLFSSTYAPFADRAQRDGWPCRKIEAGHFHMLVEPEVVAGTLIDLAAEATSTRNQPG
jgi:hypothetical protein